jgi:hypothetical protein
MGKVKEVTYFEQELVEHIEMLRLAREENDKDLEEVCPASPLLVFVNADLILVTCWCRNL